MPVNTIPTRLRSLLFAAIAILLGTTACDTTGIEDALEDFNVVVELPPINTTGGIVLQDAVTKELITSPLTVTFTGEYADDIIDMYSDPLPTANIDGGVLNFGLDNGVVPSESNPVTVTMTLSANGYVTKTHRITFTETGNNGFHVNMMAEANPPTGVTVESFTTPPTTNGVSQDTLVLTIQNDEVEAPASITIPANTQYLNESGMPATGAINATVRSYDLNEIDALGQLDSRLFDDVEDTTVVLVSALDIDLTDATGASITSFATNQTTKSFQNGSTNSGEYIINFILNSSTYSELQQLLRLAYISPATAERFILYSVPEISQLNDGDGVLRYALNSGVFKSVALVYFTEQPCNKTLSVERNGNDGTLPIQITEKGFYRAADVTSGRSELELRNITRGFKNIQVELPWDNYLQSVDLCGTTNPSISLPTPPISLTDATVNVTLQCENPSQKLRVTDIPAATALYRKNNALAGTAWRVATSLNFDYSASEQAVLGGSAVLNGVEQGERYDFKFTYDNNVEDGTLLVGGQSVDYVHTTSSSSCQ